MISRPEGGTSKAIFNGVNYNCRVYWKSRFFQIRWDKRKKLHILADRPQKYFFRRPFCIQIFSHQTLAYPKFNVLRENRWFWGHFDFWKKWIPESLMSKLFFHQIKLAIYITYVTFSVSPNCKQATIYDSCNPSISRFFTFQ